MGTDDEGTLLNEFLQNVDPEVVEALEARQGPLDGFDTPRLLLEIKHHVVKRSDIGDQVHMMEVTQDIWAETEKVGDNVQPLLKMWG